MDAMDRAKAVKGSFYLSENLQSDIMKSVKGTDKVQNNYTALKPLRC